MLRISFLVTSIFILNFTICFSQITESEVGKDGILFARYPDSIKPNNPKEGQCIYNTDLNCLECYDGNQWKSICSDSPNSSSPTTVYDQIQSSAPGWMCLQTANEYLAEFLRQNPDVSYWNQDHATQSIVAVGEPSISGATISISPTGADDTQLIENAISQVGQGGVVEGGGATFLVDDLTINQAGVTLRNMNVKPFLNTDYRLILVSAVDVTFLRVHLDMENKQFRLGIEVDHDGDRFAFVESSIKNFYNNSGFFGNMLRLFEGTDDVYIVNNEFVHSIGGANGSTSIRGIRVASSNIGSNPKGGIIASNLFEDFQTAALDNHADAIVFQSFDVDNQYQMGFRMAVLANEGINCGKSLLKAQSGGVDAHSNVNHWKDLNGELGVRVTLAHYTNDGVSNCRWTNNLGISDQLNPNSDSYFMVLTTDQFAGDLETDNVVMSCNKYVHNADTSNGKTSHAFTVHDWTAGTNGFNLPVMSNITNNVIEGQGTLRYVWWFRDVNDSTGSQFDHSQNQITVNYQDLYNQD